MDIMTITGIAGMVVKGVKFLHDSKVSDDCFIRAYYFEVTKNIEILKLIDFDKIDKEEINSESFKSLINSLNIEIGSALLCTDEKYRKNIVAFLKEGLQIQAPKDKSFDLENDDEKAVSELQINVLKAAWFTVNKIDLLRSLSNLEGNVFNRNFRIKVRLKNILERFVHIQIKLSEKEAVRKIK